MLYISPSTPANLIHVKRISNITVTIFLFFMIFIFFVDDVTIPLVLHFQYLRHEP